MFWRRAALIPGVNGLSDKGSLDGLGLYIPQMKRVRRDIIETYKILRGFDGINHERMFPLANI